VTGAVGVSAVPRPRVYVYELPGEFNTFLAARRQAAESCVLRDYVSASGGAKWSSNLYGAEVALHEALLVSPHRVSDPEEADYFFVPSYGGCFISEFNRPSPSHWLCDRCHKGKAADLASLRQMRWNEALLQHLAHAYPYWNRSNGADHLWPFTHDEGACYAPASLRQAILLVHWGRTHSRPNGSSEYHLWRVQPDARRMYGWRRCYDPCKDVVVPSWRKPEAFAASPYLRKSASTPAAAATDARSAPRPTAATNDGLGPLPKDLVSLSLQPKVPCAYSGGSYIGGSAQSFAVPSQTVQQSTSMVPPVTRPSAPLAPGAVPGTTLLAGGASPFSGCGSCAPPPFSWDPTRTTTPPGHVGAQLGATGRAHGNPTGIGSNLRPLLIPEALISTFERLAASNTARNIETCGILVGTVVNGELRTDRLLLPSQTGTSDTCTTTDENEIWDYCSGQGACTFGWIHTHPTQTCFLSSMDLHTHCGYQSMLDEAVAIVLSPSRTPRHGVFRLSHPDPPGLRELQRCRKHGFHPDHQRNGQDAGNGVYEHSTHIRWTQTPIQVVDLRKPK